MKFLPLSVLLISPAIAAIEPNAIFQSGAVLQRNSPVPVWGTSTREGEKVTIKFGSYTTSTIAKNGQWSVKLPAMPASRESRKLTIIADNTVTLEDILVGEVWLCSGQSNMNFRLSMKQPDFVENHEAEIAAAKYPEIRFFTVGETLSPTPKTTVTGKWLPCNPTNAADFSALAYFFGSELHKRAKGMPVGLIAAAAGGTRIESWMGREVLAQMPEGKNHVASFDASLANFERDVAAGKNPPAQNDPRQGNNICPGGLRNTMIAPLAPLAMRGVIWYQGESNVGNAGEYRKLFPAMVADWRALWKREDLPFLFVQIAPFSGLTPELRESQFLSLADISQSAMVVTTDVGDANNIHPTRKRTVGERLLLAARAVAYGEKIEYSGPLFREAKFSQGKATISFSHSDGLVAKDGDLKGFIIAGEDKKFHPARATIVGNQVVATSEQVPKPVAVRYGWANVPDVNLYNRAALPASPFRSDAP